MDIALVRQLARPCLCRRKAQRRLAEQAVRASAERRRARAVLSSGWAPEGGACFGPEGARADGCQLSRSAAGSLRLTLVSELAALTRAAAGGAGARTGSVPSPVEQEVCMLLCQVDHQQQARGCCLCCAVPVFEGMEPSCVSD